VHRNASIPYDVRGEVIVTNSAGHDIDAVRWLLGQEIEEEKDGLTSFKISATLRIRILQNHWPFPFTNPRTGGSP
jgi:hypothetical protein